ncbi:hypothetical protein AM571_CH02557 [Rhizobium etli 8C-3]|uniref:Uncharacterized protein (DUF2164 family) n=2 Tax=Rhizobium TaxID=379 RepID=A0A4R3RWY8_9HYPH|nr:MULTISPECIES: DUF2164 domain-containing protein [Rhizobium]APO75365.1 hypothetical protein AM571_CH02557 [Rhizobium etli 8C-3]TCU25542.1 uncharacterized protein (DUF2164 family) [Rhizobium azibense]TCU40171.1 uncharacterized protein (DUF2164 family) [Rhizobium azibense]
MKPIDFSREDKAALIARIQHFFEKELDHPVGLLRSELVLDFFAKEIGAAYYRQGLQHAHTAFLKRADDLADDIYGLEQGARD